MLYCPCAPFWHTFRVSAPAVPSSQHASYFQPRAAPRPHLARAIKNPTARLAVGDKVKDSAVPPRLTRHRCRVHSSTANTVRLLTRALRPRLLVTFRLSPPGPILSGSVPAGITPSPTLSQSVSRFLPVNGLLSCFYAITAFSHCQRILTRFFKFSARTAPQRAPSAHPSAHRLMRAMYIAVPRRPSNFPPCASLKCRALPHKLLFRARQHALSASAVRKRHAFDKNKKQPAPKTHAQNHRRISMILCARQRVVRPHTACFASNDYS